jgi:hypothetical protein
VLGEHPWIMPLLQGFDLRLLTTYSERSHTAQRDDLFTHRVGSLTRSPHRLLAPGRFPCGRNSLRRDYRQSQERCLERRFQLKHVTTEPG